MGERDLTLDVLERKGEVLFHGIAVKPGKPTAFGRIGGTPVLGMPGYPTSCLSNAYMLLIPLLRKLAHLPPHRPRTVSVPAAQRFVSTTGRHQFYTVRVENGQAVAAFKASGDITSMSKADGFVEIPCPNRHRGSGGDRGGETLLVLDGASAPSPSPAGRAVRGPAARPSTFRPDAVFRP